MKRSIIWLVIIIILLAAAYMILPGFTKVGSAYIADYTVSADGTSITLTVGVGSSMGFIRDVAIHQQYGGRMYLDCYAAFGGLNGHWGAEQVYTLPLSADTTVIALYRAADCYQTVLEKNDDGTWHLIH